MACQSQVKDKLSLNLKIKTISYGRTKGTSKFYEKRRVYAYVQQQDMKILQQICAGQLLLMIIKTIMRFVKYSITCSENSEVNCTQYKVK